MRGHADKKAASREYFDRFAESYEADRRWRRLKEPRTEAVAALGLEPGDVLLDVGCGSGLAVREVASRVARAVGIDLAPKMIEQARERSHGLENVEFLVADSEHLPYPDGEFTAVLCTSSLHHYPDPGRAVKEMGRVLAPAGRLALGDINRDRFFMAVIDRLGRRAEQGHVRIRSTAEIDRYLGDAGLTPVSYRRLWRGGYLIVLAQKRQPAGEVPPPGRD